MRDWSYFSTVMLPGEDITLTNYTLNETMNRASVTFNRLILWLFTQHRSLPDLFCHRFKWWPTLTPEQCPSLLRKTQKARFALAPI